MPCLASWGGREAPEDDADHGPVDHGFGVGGEAFVVVVQAPAAADPGQGAFDDPAAEQNLESLLPLRFAHNLQDDPQARWAKATARPAYAAVGPGQREGGHCGLGLVQDPSSSVAVLHGGRGDHDHDQKADGVHDDAPLGRH